MTVITSTGEPLWARLRRTAAKTGVASGLIGVGAALHAALHALPVLHAAMGGAALACAF